MEFKDKQIIPLVINIFWSSPRTHPMTEHAYDWFWMGPEVCQALPKCTNKCMRRSWTHLSKCDRFVPRNIICIFTSKHSTITPIQLLRNLLNKTNRGGRGKISLHIHSLVSKHHCGKTVWWWWMNLVLHKHNHSEILWINLMLRTHRCTDTITLTLCGKRRNGIWFITRIVVTMIHIIINFKNAQNTSIYFNTVEVTWS